MRVEGSRPGTLSAMADLLDEFELVPPDAPAVSADERLDAAEREALEDPLAGDDGEEPLIPFGRTWQFDWETRRFTGLQVRGEEALQQLIVTALQTARGAHGSVPEEFGFDDPDDFIGQADPAEAMADYETRLRDALLQIRRIEEIDDFDYEIDQEAGIVYLETLTIITDSGEAVPLEDVPVQLEV